MASDLKINELFEAAKASRSFPGLSDEDIRGACMKYKDVEDARIDEAIRRMRVADEIKENFVKEAVVNGRKEVSHNENNHAI